MARQIDIEQNKDHVAGGFEWKRKPSCSCGQLFEAIEEKFVFVSNFVDGEGDEMTNQIYMMPITSDGVFARSNGVSFSCCPWCGDKFNGCKKYPTPSA